MGDLNSLAHRTYNRNHRVEIQIKRGQLEEKKLLSTMANLTLLAKKLAIVSMNITAVEIARYLQKLKYWFEHYLHLK